MAQCCELVAVFVGMWHALVGTMKTIVLLTLLFAGCCRVDPYTNECMEWDVDGNCDASSTVAVDGYCCPIECLVEECGETTAHGCWYKCECPCTFPTCG
jgi:hypothetical protein